MPKIKTKHYHPNKRIYWR